jgi:hypothetical protein
MHVRMHTLRHRDTHLFVRELIFFNKQKIKTHAQQKKLTHTDKIYNAYVKLTHETGRTQQALAVTHELKVDDD